MMLACPVRLSANAVDNNPLQKICEATAVVLIRMREHEARKVRLSVALGELRYQFINQWNVPVVVVLSHDLVVQVYLENFGLADNNGRAIATADRPKNEGRSFHVCKHHASLADPGAAIGFHAIRLRERMRP
jgi:hypothetical protein